MKLQDGYYDHSRSEALDLLPTCPSIILDIGCGRGGVSRELRARYPQVRAVGLDLYVDPSNNYEAIFEQFTQIDLERDAPPVDLTKFDLVLLLDILEHLRDPVGLLGRLVDGVRPGCYFLVSLPNFHYYSNLIAIIRSRRFRYTNSGILDRTHLRFFGFDDAKDMLSDKLDVIDYLRHNPFENAKSRLIKRVFGDCYSAYQNIFLCQKKAI
jgi:trans-aconitate methyltransferase